MANLRDLWLSVTGQKQTREAMPDVIVHDPAALRAHDLDDPFFDDKIQSRMADVIADAAQKK
jgi:hypothetical protein